MSNATTHFEQLSRRLDVFMGRLQQRADETLDEALAAARQMVCADPGATGTASYREFTAGTASQIKDLGTKATTTFHQHFSIFEDHDDDDLAEAYEELEDKVEQWSQDLAERVDAAFAEVAAGAGGRSGSQTQQAWDDAVSDWKALKDRFTCPQCSAPVPLPDIELCAQSRYVPCTGCGTQVTYMPTDAIVYGLQVGQILAQEKTAAFEKAFDRVNGRKGDRAQAVVAEAQWHAAEQVVLEHLMPRAAAAKVEQVRTAIAHYDSEFGPEAEGAGSYQVETTYYRALMGLANTISHYRGAGRDREADLIALMAGPFGRAGCQVAAAIGAGTYTQALGQSYLKRAQACPVATDWDGKAWSM